MAELKKGEVYIRVKLTAEQRTKLKSLAVLEDKNMSEVISDLIDSWIAERERGDRKT